VGLKDEPLTKESEKGKKGRRESNGKRCYARWIQPPKHSLVHVNLLVGFVSACSRGLSCEGLQGAKLVHAVSWSLKACRLGLCEVAVEFEQCCSPSSRGRSCLFPTRPCADQVAGGALVTMACCLSSVAPPAAGAGAVCSLQGLALTRWLVVPLLPWHVA
jgi:hypothetical protein